MPSVQEALQEQYDLLSEKLCRLNQARVTESNVAIKFQLEQLIKEAENDLQKVQSQLDGIKGQNIFLEESGEHIAIIPPDVNLPPVSSKLFGRETELKLLNEAWECQSSSKTNIIVLVAEGGVGKTALLNYWKNTIQAKIIHAGERVFGRSFSHVGAGKGGQDIADRILIEMLKWFGDPNPTRLTSPEESGQRLAELIRRKRTLLILDGIEFLQAISEPDRGQILVPWLRSLLQKLSEYNPGLCVISTRLSIYDLRNSEGFSVLHHNLEYLSAEAGVDLLKSLGTKGDEKDIKKTVEELKGHALSLILLGTYLKVVYRGDINQRHLIPHLIHEGSKEGEHARQMLASYEEWLATTAQSRQCLQILCMIGLFNYPVEASLFAVLRQQPAIPEISTEWQEYSKENWRIRVSELRELRLLAEPDDDPDILDCHWLIRDYFNGKLRTAYPETWKEAHTRLYGYFYEHFSREEKHSENLDDLQDAISSVHHACCAEKYDDALKILDKQILGKERLLVEKLGAWNTYFNILMGFFPDRNLSKNPLFSDDLKTSIILHEMGFCLMMLGRLRDAREHELYQRAIKFAVKIEDWYGACISSQTLTELFMNLGELNEQTKIAEKALEYARRSDTILEERNALADRAWAAHQREKDELSTATDLFQRAEQIHQELAAPIDYPYALHLARYADHLRRIGHSENARQILLKNLAVCEQNQWNDYISLNHRILGDCAAETGDPTARYHYDTALEAIKKTVRQDILIDLLQARSRYLFRSQNTPIGRSDLLIEGLQARGRYLSHSQDTLQAFNDLELALKLAQGCGYPLYEADIHVGLAWAHQAEGDLTKAKQEAEYAYQVSQKMGYRWGKLDAEEILKRIL